MNAGHYILIKEGYTLTRCSVTDFTSRESIIIIQNAMGSFFLRSKTRFAKLWNVENSKFRQISD